MLAAELPPVVYAYDFSPLKLRTLKRFAVSSKVLSVSSLVPIPTNSAVLVWGRALACETCPSIQVEDGFLRSVGLGADLAPPVSWVFDQAGIYFDATRPSDLELILQSTEFSLDMLERAVRLRERIVASGLTKYNVGRQNWQRPESRDRVILVPGQVESDASLTYGAPGINTNMGLLQAVRQVNPDAWVIYKPHPDVLAGLRAKGQQEDQALQWCDEQVTDVSMGELLPLVDELHTMTSLAGFEALMRGKRVVCHGQPFYSGWGLTEDVCPLERRTRRLSLDELVAGALILYPTYVSRTTGRFTTPECVLDELLAWRDEEAASVSPWPRLKRLLVRLVARCRQRFV